MALSLTCKKFITLAKNLQKIRFSSTNCPDRKGLVLGIYYNEDCDKLELTPTADQFNQQTKGKLLEQIQLAGNKVKAGKSFTFWGLDQEYTAVTVVGLGNKEKKYDNLELICEERECVRTAAAAACKSLTTSDITHITLECLGDAESAAEGATLATFKFQPFKTKPLPLPQLHPHPCLPPTTLAAFHRGAILAHAQNHARHLADLPANHLTPTLFAEHAVAALRDLPITVEVRDRQWAESQQMGAFLAVAKGSIEPPQFLELTYKNGESDDKPFVLIGKGVTFDAGGISIKPASAMDEMRADMTGGATVLATIEALAQLKVETNVKVLIPLVENMPSGCAVKPGDVITAKNGKTICVDNTDAEGRLILADALAYSACLAPRGLIDVATLTGAMVVALGGAASGCFSNDDRLYQILQEAGGRSGDRVWRFPLWKYYTKQLTENSAYDLNNIGKGKGGGSCTAAAFLREFVPEGVGWMHLDIASVMGPNDTTSYLGKGMTGRPTRTLVRFIEEESKKMDCCK